MKYLQQDAHECFIRILDLVEDEISKNFKEIQKKENLEISEESVFSGYLVFNTRCLSCNNSKFIFESTSSLIINSTEPAPYNITKKDLNKKLDNFEKKIFPAKYYPLKNSEICENKNISKSGINLNKDKLFININSHKQTGNCDLQKKLFEQYFDFSIFSKKKNNYNCEICQEKTKSGFKKYYILKPPKNLVIFFNNFFQKNSKFKKQNKKIIFNQVLDLSNFVIVKKQNIYTKRDFLYNLYGIIQHKGNLHGGHYSVFIKKSEGWYYISDEFFKRVEEEEVLSSEPYLLFYTN